jgi:hypothetical protein
MPLAASRSRGIPPNRGTLCDRVADVEHRLVSLPCRRPQSLQAAAGAEGCEPPDSPSAMADDASTGLYHKVQAQLAQHGEYLVQAQRWLALFEGMNKARGHIGKRCEFFLPQPQLESSAPDLIGPERRIICSIVHTGSLPGAQPATPQAICTIMHIACIASLSSAHLPRICSIVHTSPLASAPVKGAPLPRCGHARSIPYLMTEVIVGPHPRHRTGQERRSQPTSAKHPRLPHGERHRYEGRLPADLSGDDDA